VGEEEEEEGTTLSQGLGHGVGGVFQ